MSFKIKIILCKIICCFLLKKSWREYIRSYFEIHDYKNFRFFYAEIKSKKDLLTINSYDFKYIFMGSSHVAYGFYPKFFSNSSFNFGSNSQDLFTSYSIFIDILRKYKNIQCVFIEYAVFSNGNNIAYVKNKYISTAYHDLYKINYETENYLNDYEKFICGFKVKTKNNNGYLYPPPPYILRLV